jgi:16S rRNA pseudouridine516 synthase
LKLAHLLFTQGFGARRECEGLVASGHVRIGGRTVDDPFAEVAPEGLVFEVRGQAWHYHAKALVAMNKPAGHECSQTPRHHPSVYSLLPAPLRRRDMQSVGRLDADTTGLLLFTDDGALIHRLTSPKRHVAKVYEVGCKHAVTLQQLERLRAGVQLVDDPATVRAATAETTGARDDGLHGLRLTLTDGKYHQVKRMLAAVGNRVEALHRSAFGALVLPASLGPGEWCWLDGPQAILGAPPPAGRDSPRP